MQNYQLPVCWVHIFCILPLEQDLNSVGVDRLAKCSFWWFTCSFIWKVIDLFLLFWRIYFTWLLGRILGRNWDKSLRNFPPCYSQSPRPSKSGLKQVCNSNIVYGNLKSENSQVKIMPRNLNQIVRSWIRIRIEQSCALTAYPHTQTLFRIRIPMNPHLFAILDSVSH